MVRLTHFFGAISRPVGLLQQSRHGTERESVDSLSQFPGDFVVDLNGIPKLAYCSQFCDDCADSQVLLAAIRKAVLGLQSGMLKR